MRLIGLVEPVCRARTLTRPGRIASFFLMTLLCSASLVYAQSALAPNFSVGDTWTRKDRDFTYTISVVKIEEGGTWFTGGIPNCAGCLSFYDKQLTLMKLTRPDGSDVDVMRGGFVPLGSDWKFYDFPLEVKKKWSLDARGFWQGQSTRYHADCWVMAYEEVKTPVGTFKAYRIRRNWSFRYPVGLEVYYTWGDTVWYAPEAKLEVKSETTHPALRSWELISFSVK